MVVYKIILQRKKSSTPVPEVMTTSHDTRVTNVAKLGGSIWAYQKVSVTGRLLLS